MPKRIFKKFIETEGYGKNAHAFQNFSDRKNSDMSIPFLMNFFICLGRMLILTIYYL